MGIPLKTVYKSLVTGGIMGFGRKLICDFTVSKEDWVFRTDACSFETKISQFIIAAFLCITVWE